MGHVRGGGGESDGWWGEEQEATGVGRGERKGGGGGMVGAVVHCVVEGERHAVDKHFVVWLNTKFATFARQGCSWQQ